MHSKKTENLAVDACNLKTVKQIIICKTKQKKSKNMSLNKVEKTYT